MNYLTVPDKTSMVHAKKPLNLFVKYRCILSHLSIYKDVGDQLIALYSSKGLTYILNIAIRNFGERIL